jgi:hypothetical protein
MILFSQNVLKERNEMKNSVLQWCEQFHFTEIDYKMLMVQFVWLALLFIIAKKAFLHKITPAKSTAMQYNNRNNNSQKNDVFKCHSSTHSYHSFCESNTRCENMRRKIFANRIYLIQIGDSERERNIWKSVLLTLKTKDTSALIYKIIEKFSSCRQ